MNYLYNKNGFILQSLSQNFPLVGSEYLEIVTEAEWVQQTSLHPWTDTDGYPRYVMDNVNGDIEFTDSGFKLREITSSERVLWEQIQARESNSIYVHITLIGGDERDPIGIVQNEAPLYVKVELRLTADPGSTIIDITDSWRIQIKGGRTLNPCVQFKNGEAEFKIDSSINEGIYKVDEQSLTTVEMGGINYIPRLVGDTSFKVYTETVDLTGLTPLYVFVSFPDVPEGDEIMVCNDGTDNLRTIVEIKAVDDDSADSITGFNWNKPFAIRRPDGLCDYFRPNIIDGRAEFQYKPPQNTEITGHYRVLEEDFRVVPPYRFILRSVIDFIVYRKL